MIDSHVHLLPGVDDGAKDEEQSKAMFEQAKADGVTRWIVTPHLNHPCSRFSYEELQFKFKEWSKRLNKEVAECNLLFGVEVYIDESFLLDLDKMTVLPTFENSQFMLIEFNRNVKLEAMFAAIHELRIRGVYPIMAHVEVYPVLLDHPENVKLLCNEGALIQVSASSFQDKRASQLIKSLIQSNAIDFVASDGHNTLARPPVLSDAYKIVAKKWSKEWADRLFINSPRKIFEGEAYTRPITISPIKKVHLAGMTISLLVGLVLVIIGASQLNLISGVTPKSIIQILTDEKVPANMATPETTVSPENTISIVTTETVSIEEPTSLETSTEETTEEPTSSVSIPTVDEVNEKYIAQLYSLQNQYTADVERIYNAIQDTRNFVIDEAKSKAAIDAYLVEAGDLETACDNNVYAVLYDFQNELEKYRYPVAIIEESRAEYHRIKEETKNKYLNGF